MAKIPEIILSEFAKEKKFLLAVHINPDGDALGSALALALFLESRGKETFLYCKDEIPRQYRFLPGCGRFGKDTHAADASDVMLILLDCNSPDRASIDAGPFKCSMVIDHHQTEREFGDYRWIERSAAATGLMIYGLIKHAGMKMSCDMATNLFAAIAVDTGTFRYSNTDADVLTAGADLVRCGADPASISAHLYESWERSRFDLLVLALNTMELRNGIAMIHVCEDMFRKTGTSEADTENFANYPRMIDGVRLAAFFREMSPGLWKVSMRSRGEVNVAAIAEKFGGGGHKNAAGFKIRADLETAKKSLLVADGDA